MRVNIPPVTRVLLGIVVSLSLLNAGIRYRQYANNGSDGEGKKNIILTPFLTIVPIGSLFYPWVFFTASLIEQNIVSLILTAGTIFYGGRYLERAWSSTELVKFLAVVTVIPNILTFAIYIAWFIVGKNMVRGFTTINGGVALQAGFLVVFKQLVPEHLVTILKGIIKIRVKHFPILFLVLNVLSGIILGTDTAAILASLGFMISWIYLRFYKISFPDLSSDQPSSLRGDASETFAFAYFFPEPLHGPVAAVSDSIFNALVTIRLCTPFSSADIDAGNSQAAARGETGLPGLLSRPSGQPTPGSARAEAERRRALALRALDQRLNAATTHPQGVLPHEAGQTGSSMLGETSYTPEGHEEKPPQSETQA